MDGLKATRMRLAKLIGELAAHEGANKTLLAGVEVFPHLDARPPAPGRLPAEAALRRAGPEGGLHRRRGLSLRPVQLPRPGGADTGRERGVRQSRRAPAHSERRPRPDDAGRDAPGDGRTHEAVRDYAAGHRLDADDGRTRRGRRPAPREPRARSTAACWGHWQSARSSIACFGASKAGPSEPWPAETTTSPASPGSWQVHAEFAKPLTAEDMARRAGMSNSVFHHHFKLMTACSPLQYLKRIRLDHAKRLMAHDGFNANTAARAVGYESPSQFSREFKRLFGLTPIEEADRMRARLVAG